MKKKNYERQKEIIGNILQYNELRRDTVDIYPGTHRQDHGGIWISVSRIFIVTDITFITIF